MSKGSFVRWQNTSIQQLGFSINLILALATGSLGFALSLLKDSDFRPYCWGKGLFAGSLLLLIVSIGLGIWCTINRSCDFRLTAAIARDREKWQQEGKSKNEIDGGLSARRAKAERLDARTWCLFYGQVAGFSLAILLLIVAVAMVYRTKLL